MGKVIEAEYEWPHIKPILDIHSQTTHLFPGPGREEIVAIKTEDGRLIIGKAQIKEKDRVHLKEYIELTKDTEGNQKLWYTESQIPYKYEEMYKVPRATYKELREKLRVKKDRNSKNPEHIEEFMTTVQTAKTESYSKRFQDMDQALPPELEELAEKDPQTQLLALKKMEQWLTSKSEIAEEKNLIKRLEDASPYMERIKYAQKCRVYTGTARTKLVQALNGLEKKEKQEYRKRLKEIRKAKERIEV